MTADLLNPIAAVLAAVGIVAVLEYCAAAIHHDHHHHHRKGHR